MRFQYLLHASRSLRDFTGSFSCFDRDECSRSPEQKKNRRSKQVRPTFGGLQQRSQKDKDRGYQQQCDRKVNDQRVQRIPAWNLRKLKHKGSLTISGSPVGDPSLS